MDSNTQEIVRAINRNTDELRRITAELKRIGISAKDTGSALATALRLTEPARGVATIPSNQTDSTAPYPKVFTDKGDEDG